MLWGLALLFMLVIRCFPDTPFALRSRELLVDIPLKRVATFRRHHVIFLILFIGLAMAGGDMALIFVNSDLFLSLALYFDGVTISLMVAAFASMKGMPGSIHARLSQMRRRLARRPGASRRQKRRQRPSRRAPSNDDDHAWPAFQMAA